MKTIKWFIVACLLATAAYAEDLSEADKKWVQVVDKMIAEGATTISTPAENRVKLAKDLAAKHGRDCQVEKTDSGYKIVLQARKVASK